MKFIKHTFYILFIGLFITACSEKLLDKEHYKTEIYLIGGYDRVWPIDVMYSDTPYESYFSVSSSGSLRLSQDVKVVMSINEALIDHYNNKFLGVLNQDKFLKPLPTDFYSIPNLTNTVIEHKEEIYKTVPIEIMTEGINPDIPYVIPVQIDEVSAFEINPSGEKVLIQLNMLNEFSGSYQLDGSILEAGEDKEKRIQKIKNLKAVTKDKVRMFIGAENEIDEKIDELTVCLEVQKILSKNDAGEAVFPVSITGWKDVNVTNGSGTYNEQTKTFNIEYTVEKEGVSKLYKETLTNNSKDDPK